MRRALHWILSSILFRSSDPRKAAFGWVSSLSMLLAFSLAFNTLLRPSPSPLDLNPASVEGMVELGRRDDTISRLIIASVSPDRSVGFAETCKEPFWREVFGTMAALYRQDPALTRKSRILSFTPLLKKVCVGERVEIPDEVMLLISSMVSG